MNSRFVFDRAPARVYWEITRACDLACQHCRAEAHPMADPGQLTTEEGLHLLDRLASFGAPLPHLVLTGGDPLKRADLFDLIRHARGLGLDVSVSPSGTPLLTDAAIAKLKEAGVDAISLSLDGSTAERHDAIRRVPGCYERTMSGARAAVSVGLPFQVNTLVSRETLDDVESILPVVKAMGASRWSLFFLVTVGRGLVLSPISAEQCERLFEWVATRPRQGGPIITTTEAPHYRRVLMSHMKAHADGGRPVVHGLGIRDGNGIMFISSTGDVTPSGFLPMTVANVRDRDIVSIYREADVFVSLRRADAFEGRCGRCEYREACGGSRARAYAATGRLLAEDPLCLYEPGAAEHPATHPSS